MEMRDEMLTGHVIVAAGKLERMLKEAGFSVERLAGPPGGKREILRGTKLFTD